MLISEDLVGGLNEAARPAHEDEFGALGRKVERPEDLMPALRWALAAAEDQQLPVVLDVKVDSDEAVLPMVPAAASGVLYTRDSAEEAIAAGHADLIAFGRPYLSNPDLVERFAHGWELNPPAEVTTWSAPTAEGYTDFPFHVG